MKTLFILLTTLLMTPALQAYDNPQLDPSVSNQTFDFCQVECHDRSWYGTTKNYSCRVIGRNSIGTFQLFYTELGEIRYFWRGDYIVSNRPEATPESCSPVRAKAYDALIFAGTRRICLQTTAKIKESYEYRIQGSLPKDYKHTPCSL